ncbi:MAG: helix-turn-helix domain-containing protein [Chitinispirillales bacterium]|jgi:AraC-like DNA-binding protein|nr:helix-turn-helix domain-containing protein [Chitinispirillales bacterium]
METIIDTVVAAEAVFADSLGLDGGVGSLSLSNILFFVASIMIIAVTLYFFYFRKRKTRRFLTTMRLSVLDKTVQQACRYIEHHYSNQELTVSGVCRELVTGEAYLNTLFVKELGINAEDFIVQVRVNAVKFLLTDNPELDANRICVQCGFTDRSSAEVPFARLCGVTMEEYARSAREQQLP